jgi:hypothetical protein
MRICVEVDLEAGLPEAVKLKVGAWQHYQKLDYEQLPFKCRSCHEYGHFQRNCPKAQSADKTDGEGWQQPKKSKANLKPKEKKNTGPAPIPQATNEALEAQTANTAACNRVEAQEEQSSDPKDKRKGEATADPEAPEGPTKEKDTDEEHISLASESEEESDDEDSGTSSSQITPKKSTRGRKSKKKEREEKTYLDVLQGSQKTLKGMVNTRNTKKQGRAQKGATASQPSK